MANRAWLPLSFILAGALAAPVSAKDGGFFGIAEFLYMRPTDGRSGYGSVDDATVPTNIQPKSAQIEFHPGFRLGVGYLSEDSNTDTALFYSHISAQGGSDAAASPNGAIRAIWPFTASASAKSASALNEFSYSAMDWEAGRGLEIGTIYARLHGGLRYAELKRTFRVIYFGGILFSNTGNRIEENISFRGIGPRMGMDFTVPLFGGFSLAPGMAGTALIGNNHRNLYFEYPTVPPTALSESPRKIQVAAELALALNYARPLGDGLGLECSLGYRIEHWPTLLDSPGFNYRYDPGSSYLNLDGAFFRTTLHF